MFSVSSTISPASQTSHGKSQPAPPSFPSSVRAHLSTLLTLETWSHPGFLLLLHCVQPVTGSCVFHPTQRLSLPTSPLHGHLLVSTVSHQHPRRVPVSHLVFTQGLLSPQAARVLSSDQAPGPAIPLLHSTFDVLSCHIWQKPTSTPAPETLHGSGPAFLCELLSHLHSLLAHFALTTLASV